MKHIPLFFRVEENVAGPRFAARVRFVGRVTCTREFGSTWMYGVNPGALAEEGDGMRDAYANFRKWLRLNLVDMAELAGSFDEFCAEVRSFVDSTDETSVNEWEAARKAVRAGEDPGLDADLDLKRETGDFDTTFEAIQLPSQRPDGAYAESTGLSQDQQWQLAA